MNIHEGLHPGIYNDRKLGQAHLKMGYPTSDRKLGQAHLKMGQDRKLGCNIYIYISHKYII